MKKKKCIITKWYADKFVTIVPDLYRGKVATDHETAGHLFKNLNWKGAIQDIQATVSYLNSKGVNKIGIVGFCMGGALSLVASVQVDGLHASAPFYGISNMADPGQAKIPLQLHFGTNDSAMGFSDPATQDACEKSLKDNHRVYEFFRYEGAEHGFVNENKECFNKEYAELAHARTLEFFSKYLN